jgi:hypothetical protein
VALEEDRVMVRCHQPTPATRATFNVAYLGAAVTLVIGRVAFTPPASSPMAGRQSVSVEW